MIKIFVPTPLRKFTDGASSFEVQAVDVGQAIGELVAAFPELARHLYDGEQNLRRFVRIYVGDEDIQALEGAQTSLKNGDEVSIIPAIAGG